MTNLPGLGAALLLAACAAGPGPATAPAAPPPATSPVLVLKNAGFEAISTGARCPPGWGCSAHADPDAFAFRLDPAVKSEGRQSLRVERVTPEPWGLATQFVEAGKLRGARVRFSMALKLEGMEGNGAGPVFISQGASGVTLTSKQDLAKGTADWKRVALEFLVPRGAEGFEVGLLIEGPGKAWIDDARLEVLEMPQAD